MTTNINNIRGPVIGPPQWAGDGVGPHTLQRGPFKVVAAGFPFLNAVTVTTSAGAAIGAVSLAVTALSAAIPAGTTLYFPGTNTLSVAPFAITTQDVAAAATAIPVIALTAAIGSGAVATVSGTGTKKPIRSGTVVGRTIAQRNAGTGFHIAVATDDEVRIIAFDIPDALINDDCELYMPGKLVKENFLANIASLDATTLGKLRTTYVCTVGAP